MIVAVFRRRLRPGKTFEDFQTAWEAERGFGVPTRVFSAVSLTDPEEILSVGFVDLDPDELKDGFSSVAEQEQARHDRISEVIESTELRTFYELRAEHDLSGAPRQIPLGAPESLLAMLAGDDPA